MAFSELVGAILFRLGVARLGARVVVAITVAGFHDFDDEIGHVHFDVEFDEISEGVELDIAGVVSEEMLRGEDDLHDVVGKRHHGNKEDLAQS